MIKLSLGTLLGMQLPTSLVALIKAEGLFRGEKTCFVFKLTLLCVLKGFMKSNDYEKIL